MEGIAKIKVMRLHSEQRHGGVELLEILEANVYGEKDRRLLVVLCTHGII